MTITTHEDGTIIEARDNGDTIITRQIPKSHSVMAMFRADGDIVVNKQVFSSQGGCQTNDIYELKDGEWSHRQICPDRIVAKPSELVVEKIMALKEKYVPAVSPA